MLQDPSLRKKGGDIQQDPVAVPTAKHQNTRCKNTKDLNSMRRKRDIRHVNIKHKRLHINRRDQWATGADFGRPFATPVANGVVSLITCAQPSHFSNNPEVSKNVQLWCKTTSSLGYSGLAVLKGAVYVGHVPVLNVRKYSEPVPVLEGAEYLGDVQYAVSLRAPRYSFGMQSWPEWNSTNYPHSKKTRIGDKDRCADVFLKYSTKGEYISPGTKRSHSVHAVKKEDYLESAIYTSDKEEDPKFTDEVGCRRFCLIRVDLPNLPKGATMEVQGTMIFGWKELRVQITDLNSRQLYADVTIDLN
ncbi:hypothetical protein FSP39_012638 [Pinctada imbricata]|uniref:Uncharacterized protein n=1 Tax=Pinctada imbricata TaxID=66713 RepID=A0AA89BXB4_PINIB|nr:hypothetical protein FSP39_012638 [Pinctada imbricata]